MSILSEAQNIVDGDRQQTYGTPRENHTRTAELWSAYLGTKVTARDVCMMNILQKASRDRFKPHRDNLIDIAGYAENAQRCEPLDPARDFLQPLIDVVKPALESTAKFYEGRCRSCVTCGEITLRCARDAGHEGRHNSNSGPLDPTRSFQWD